MTKLPDTKDALRSRLEAVHTDSFGWALVCAGGDRDLAEEALSVSYLKVLDGRARFAGRSSFKSWLFGVIRLSAAELRRRRAWRRFLPFDDGAQTPDPRPSSETALVSEQDAAALQQALRHLAERQRQLLHLVFYQELTVDQAAQILGIRVGTARTHYQRGKARLRRLLEEKTR